MTGYVIDYVTMPATPAQMKAAGVVGVVRYLSDGPKGITQGEKGELDGIGIEQALVRETTATMTNGGAAAGVAEGQAANRLADQLGYPRSQPIFYAVDHDASPAEMDTIEAFLNAAEAQGRPSEVYGSFAVVEEMFRRGASPKPWQAYAWSHGQRSSHAVLFQRIDRPISLPGSFDVNDVLAADWNQTNRPAPPAPPAPPVQHKGKSMIAVVTNHDGRLEKFTFTAFGTVQHSWQPKAGAGPWSSPPLQIGGPVDANNGLAAAVNADGRLEVFAYGADWTERHCYQTDVKDPSKWSDWGPVS